MYLPNELVSQFVKATKDEAKPNNETTVFGTTKKVGDKIYVQFDGSEILTPVSNTTAEVKDSERVTVLLKNHSATITGNASDPSASGKDFSELSADVRANYVKADVLEADYASIDYLKSEYIDAETIKAEYAEIDFANVAEATIDTALIKDAAITQAKIADASITNAKIDNAAITLAKIDQAVIDSLDAKYATFEGLDAKYANINFTNITKAAIEYFYATSGLIKDVVVGDQTITGELVGVTIKGDLIEGNTVVADKLVIRGDDGLFYKLNTDALKESDLVDEEGNPILDENGEPIIQDQHNSLNGSIIMAKSITATKISVSDLVAFDATIGGFVINDNSIHSFAKDTVDNTIRGIYMDNDGQMAFGDESNYVKYYYDEAAGVYKLDISAGSFKINVNGSNKTVEEVVNDAVSDVVMPDLNIGGRNYLHRSATYDEWIFPYENNIIILDDDFLNIRMDNKRLDTTNEVIIPSSLSLEDGVEYTLSFEAYSEQLSTPTCLRNFMIYKTGNNYFYIPNCEKVYLTSTPTKYKFTWTQINTFSHADFVFFIGDSLGENSNMKIPIYIRNLKIEQGNTSTDWTPSPNDYVYDGVNRLLRTDYSKYIDTWKTYGDCFMEISNDGFLKIHPNNQEETSFIGAYPPIISKLESNTVYTLSFYTYFDAENFIVKGNIHAYILLDGSTNDKIDLEISDTNKINYLCRKITHTFKTTNAYDACSIIIGFDTVPYYDSTNDTIIYTPFYIKDVKLEKGYATSDWCAAEEDGIYELAQTNVIIQANDEKVTETLKGYATNDDLKDLEIRTNAQMELLSDSLNVSISETRSKINETQGVLQEQINTITKYFTFDINGLTIGQVDNPYKVIIDNDRYSMTVNGVEVLWIADGKVYAPEIEVARSFKLFDYRFEQDSNGNVNCYHVENTI